MGHYAKRFFGKGEPRDPDFVFTVDTRITASSTVAGRYQFVLKAGDKDVIIDWGDGTINNYTATAATTVGRTYATAGIYQIRIAGSYPGFEYSGNYYNSRIVSLDNWGTNEFTDMSLMFAYASNMIANYTDKPNTSKVTTFRSCFFRAEKFNGIVNFDTSNAVSLRGVFYNSSGLLPQSFAHFNIEKLEPGTNTGLDLFMANTSAYTPLDMNEPRTTDNYDDTLISFASQNAPNGIVAHFGNSVYSDRGKAAREALVAKGWTITDAGYEWATDADFSGTTNGKFKYTGTKQYVVIPHIIKGINVTSYYQMFADKSIKGVYSDNLNVTDMGGMFQDTTSSSIDLTYLNTSKVTNMNAMFSRAKATSLDLSSFDTSNVTNMRGMFNYSNATSLDLSSFDTSKVTVMNYMFAGTSVTSLDLSSFDTSNVTSMGDMFRNSKATTGYARTQADADRFNAIYGKPSALNFIVKPQ